MVKEKIITAAFGKYDTVSAYGLYQYDYGAKLRIEGLQLPKAVEVHYSTHETGGTSEPRIGITEDGVTVAPIPDSLLENGGATQDYTIYAYIYLADANAGQTIKKITMPVTARPRPEIWDTPEDADLFREAIAAVNSSAERAEKAAESIRGYVEGAKADIDEYVADKEAELRGETGTSPHIGDNNHWYIGDTDTGVDARGTDGITPHIGDNGHWWIGDVDTGVVAGGGGGGAVDDVQIDGQSIVGEDRVAVVPVAEYNKTFGVVFPHFGLQIAEAGQLRTNPASINEIKGRSDSYRPLTAPSIDIITKLAMTDGKGAAWTDTEKTGAWSRLSSIKTTMDEVAVAGASYILGELTELSVVLPDDALIGQEVTVAWYNGDTPATLAITGNMLDFDYTPSANTRSEISALWDGQFWSVIGMSQDVPTEEVTE